jgi:NAD(P)-dependent dehydrogenase (short-subunit alcohol dehydrogenase family)
VILNGKVAVVTGGGQGIGRAIALALAKEGADIAILDIDENAAREVADEVRALGHQALARRTDVSRSQEVKEAVQATLDKLGRIDILVNNAGINKVSATIDVSDSLWDKIVDTNLKSMFYCCREVGKHMLKQGHGKVVNIASIAAHESSPGSAPYSASKAGVLGLSRALAVEWGPQNINVNVVSPGLVETALIAGINKESPGYLSNRVDRTPLKRLQRPEDVAAAVLFLVSPMADNITGQVTNVDGGQTALNSSYTWPKS